MEDIYLLTSIPSYIRKLEIQVMDYESTLQLIATGKRPDGTYNRSREACEQEAREVLEAYDAWITITKSDQVGGVAA